jgi:hypothetical protein
LSASNIQALLVLPPVHVDRFLKCKNGCLFGTGGAKMSHEGSLVFAVACLQYDFDNNLHDLRRQNQTNTREFQRVETHRLRYVHDLCHLACLYSNLFWHTQLVPGKCIVSSLIAASTRTHIIIRTGS